MNKRLIAFSLIIWLQGCCGSERTEPSYPADVVGWKDFKDGTTKMRGRFVLRKGEQTDNGSLQITILDLLPPKCTGDTGDFSARARVIFEFKRLKDQSILCSEIFPENGGGNLVRRCAGIFEEFGVAGVGVQAVNIKEGWVFFILTGDY